MPIRTFIAVTIAPPPPLAAILAQFASMGRAVKPVASDSMHVTLKFLGDTDESLLPSIVDVLLQSVAGMSPFEARLVGIGAFPHPQRPSVVWAGLQNAETLVDIAARLERALQPLGFLPEQRPFHPHLTLARVKFRPPDNLRNLIETHRETQFGTAPIRSVELIQSELRPEGSRYTPLASAALGSI